jgi:glycine/D-amino acid oxidase-like deaminating enzyme
MKKITKGLGTLRRQGDITELNMLDTAVYAVREGGTVRIVVIEKGPGGAELEVRLSAQDAAQFASAIYALARTAIIRNEREAAEAPSAPQLQAVAA